MFELDPKDCSDVINSLSSSLLLWHVEGSSDQILLLVLDLHHLTLNGVLGDVLVDEDILGLSQPVDPVKALPLTGWVPGRIKQQQVISCCQVQSHTSSLGKI